MITAKDAFTKTMAFVKMDEDALMAKIDAFIDDHIGARVEQAIADRQLYCGVDVPKELKGSGGIICQKLNELGYKTAISHGMQTSITIGWAQ